MSVSGIGSGGPSAAQIRQFQQLARERGGQSGGAGRSPELPSGFQGIVESALQNAGSPADLKSRVESGFAEYQKSDEYKALSSEKQAALQDLVKNGPKAPPEGFDPSKLFAAGGSGGTSAAVGGEQTQADLIKQLFEQLEQKGERTRQTVSQQFLNRSAEPGTAGSLGQFEVQSDAA